MFIFILQHMDDDAGETESGRYVGFVPGRVLVDLIMGVWGGFFSLLVVDLVSRFAGLPIPGNVVSTMSSGLVSSLLTYPFPKL